MEENRCLREVIYNDKMWREFPLSKNNSHINFLICQSWKKRESFTLWKIGVCLGTTGSYRHSFAFWHFFLINFFEPTKFCQKAKSHPAITHKVQWLLAQHLYDSLKFALQTPLSKRLTITFFPLSHCFTSNPPLLVCLIQLKSNFCIFWMMTSCQNCVTLGLLDQDAIFTQQD